MFEKLGLAFIDTRDFRRGKSAVINRNFVGGKRTAGTARRYSKRLGGRTLGGYTIGLGEMHAQCERF